MDEAAYVICMYKLKLLYPIEFYDIFYLDNNKSLLPNFEVTEEFFDMKIREYIHRYNYTYNPDGIYRAIKYMYTYWPDPKNTTHIREETINVSSTIFILLHKSYKYLTFYTE